MKKLRSKEWWVFNIIMALGMTLVMSISVPLIMGAPLIMGDLLVYGIIGFLSAMTVNILLPMNRIAKFVNQVFTKKNMPALQSLVVITIMTIVVSSIIQVAQGLTSPQDWLNLIKVLPIITMVAYLFSFLFAKISDWILK